MTGVPKPSDLTATYTATYDAWNRLVEVKSGANVVLKCEYDGLNRRTKKHINTGEDQVYDEFRHFFYNSGWQILETRKSTSENTEPETTLKPERQYVWSLRYIDAPVLRDENKDDDDDCIDGEDERLYYLTDANMNVTALVDTGGDAVERYLYDPYGKVTILNGANNVDKDGDVTEWTEDTDQTASDVDNAILYCGYYHDWETGLYHVRHRMYHPTLGRWLQRDPIGYADGMSLYEYVRSAPASRVDPLGTMTLLPPGVFGQHPGYMAEAAFIDAMHAAAKVLGKHDLPPHRSGAEFATSYKYCCDCVPEARKKQDSQRRYAEAHEESARLGHNASESEQFVRGQGWVQTAGASLAKVKIKPASGRCAGLIFQAAGEHERVHWQERNRIMRDARRGRIRAKTTWERGRDDPKLRAPEERRATDAARRFYQEFIDACGNKFGVGRPSLAI